LPPFGGVFNILLCKEEVDNSLIYEVFILIRKNVCAGRRKVRACEVIKKTRAKEIEIEC